MTDWSRLSHAYGTAEDVPGLLDRVASGRNDQGWSDLWSALCHQGSVYSASFAALPRLLAIASDQGTREDDAVMALALAAAIVAGEDQPHDAGDVRARHAADIDALGRIATRMLPTASDRYTYVYLLQAVLAFEGVPVWGHRLEDVNNDEYEIECPECSAVMFVAFGDDGHFSCTGDYAIGADVPKLPLRPAAPETLTGLPERLHTTAHAHGQEDVAVRLTYLFGAATCPDCKAEFTVADQVHPPLVTAARRRGVGRPCPDDGNRPRPGRRAAPPPSRDSVAMRR
ncbi:hypothetical protein [Actinomadura bangladeshensis]|uniref:Uncharacterized protein n=1 Tax=Actinomadura bangladeshensis TaxID=453573 RepID=A0A4R4NJS2_9ACTN|nr:hypothetical protein [Actinomadura bangladeshensis]TDC07192.1 hypothetical protein E1284_32710 [Actinomadura bangladeshensis]